MRATARLRAGGCPAHLIVAGDGPLRAEIEALIDQLALRDRVDLIGQRDDVPELIAVADAVVLPSVREGLSNVILEGMMGGKPVVASRAGGNVELVEHERSGLLFDVGDDAGLAQAFIRLANDAGLRKRLGDGARERALNHFSIPSMVRAYERTYSDVVRERATTP
jgi:glycosyltransferase involved in cell wall biosynthesis